MRIFISGGCKNGKSFYAQRLAKGQQAGVLYYVATMKPVDAEDDERISRHRLERDGWGFVTLEQPVDIEDVLRSSDSGGSFLLDSLTALLANEMFSTGGEVDLTAEERIIDGLSRVVMEIENIVIVSDFIYSDAFVYDLPTERFRKSLAEIDRAVAKICDVVVEVSYSGLVVHKGELRDASG